MRSPRSFVFVLLGTLLVGGGWLFFNRASDARAVRLDRAVHALERIKDWATWMTGLQTAAIGAYGFWFEKWHKQLQTPLQRGLTVWGLCCFGLSILVATWVLACLPSIEERLVENASTCNDIFELPIFERHAELLPKLGKLTGLFHFYFVLGALAFGWLGLNYLHSQIPKDTSANLPEDAPQI